MKKCLVTVEGGLGKSVMFTSLLPELHEKYEEIYTISAYPDVFMCCKDVKQSFTFGPNDEVFKLVNDDNCDVLWREPYSSSNFIKKKCHLFDAWREEYKLPKHDNQVSNTMDISDKFKDIAKRAYNDHLATGKFMLVQFYGGQSPIAMKNVYDATEEPLQRNYFEAGKLVELLHKKFPNEKIINYSLPNEPEIEGAIKLQRPYIFYNEFAKYAERIICIDSSLQHLATGKNEHINVIWGETRPEHFGYEINKNFANKVENAQPYFKPLGKSPADVTFTSPEIIIDSLI